MDHYLLALWNSTSSGEIKVYHVAEIINLSAKQARRKLNQWQDEGWLTFQAGRGRGNASILHWKKDVEPAFEQQLLTNLEHYSIEQVSRFLLYKWSPETKQRLMTRFQTKFGFLQEDQDSLIIPRFYRFLTFHPLKAADVHSANLVANVYNRILALNEDHTITPELAHSWELSDTQLTLYLRKDVTFHDGSVLKADDVVQSFVTMKQHQDYADLWEPVTNITSPSPHVVELEFKNGCTYILQLLSMIPASIYKEVYGQIIGTGGFYILEDSEERTVLCAHKHYYGERPLLDRVEFIQVSKEFGAMYYGSANETRDIGTFDVESDSGFGIVVMNACRESDIARKEVRDYIHMLIDQNRKDISEVNSRITVNAEGCLIGYSRTYSMPKLEKPVMSGPLLIKYVNYTKDVSYWLRDILEHAGIEVAMEEITFEDAVYSYQLNLDADLFVHGEIFEMNQSFSYFIFMKNRFSPLHTLTQSDEQLKALIATYTDLPFELWMGHHLKIEDYLINRSLCIPLYYSKRQIPFSINLMNVKIKHFGYVDLSKLWMKNHR